MARRRHTDSEGKYFCKADPNPACKTFERVLTGTKGAFGIVAGSLFLESESEVTNRNRNVFKHGTGIWWFRRAGVVTNRNLKAWITYDG